MNRRQTGRTTRMLEQALDHAWRRNEQVLVVMATETQVRYARRILDRLIREGHYALRSRVITISTISRAEQEGFDWTLLQSGIFRRVFVDHHAIEMRFARVLRELHAYDLPETANTPQGGD